MGRSRSLLFDRDLVGTAADLINSEPVRITYVYGLYEGFSNVPFYIGVSMHPKRRLSAHRAAADGRRRDSLTDCGIKASDISMRLLAECDDRGNAETIEKALQAYYNLHIVTQERLVRGSRSTVTD